MRDRATWSTPSRLSRRLSPRLTRMNSPRTDKAEGPMTRLSRVQLPLNAEDGREWTKGNHARTRVDRSGASRAALRFPLLHQFAYSAFRDGRGNLLPVFRASGHRFREVQRLLRFDLRRHRRLVLIHYCFDHCRPLNG